MLPNTSSFGIRGADAEELVLACAMDVELWTGSVQYRGHANPGPSPVLLASGMSKKTALETVRMSLGRSTTQDDMDSAVAEIATASRSVLECGMECAMTVDGKGESQE